MSVLSPSLDSFHCSEDEVSVGLGDRESVAGQDGGARRTVEKILSGCLNIVEYRRRVEDLNMRCGK